MAPRRLPRLCLGGESRFTSAPGSAPPPAQTQRREGARPPPSCQAAAVPSGAGAALRAALSHSGHIACCPACGAEPRVVPLELGPCDPAAPCSSCSLSLAEQVPPFSPCSADSPDWDLSPAWKEAQDKNRPHTCLQDTRGPEAKRPPP